MANARFHSKGGFGFTRLDNGGVAVDLEYPEKREVRTVFLAADEWASVVAHMTAEGGTVGSFKAAQALHARIGEPDGE